MAYAVQTTSFATGFAARVAAMVEDFQERLERRRVYNQTLNELSALSGRELADLGLHRSNLRAIAYEAAYRK